MTSKEIRQKFLEFFKSKEHEIVPSASIVLKDDPTLMFSNSGMAQFKDFFSRIQRTEICPCSRYTKVFESFRKA